MSQITANSVRQANQFVLTNCSIQINYSTSSFTGLPQLTYQNENKSLNFQGDDIRVQQTEIGHLVTVTLEIIPDLLTRTLSVLIPTVNFREPENQTSIKTLAIETVERTTIAGPELVEGAIQTYQTIPLEGTASFVVF